jgi:hypothetical protein
MTHNVHQEFNQFKTFYFMTLHYALANVFHYFGDSIASFEEILGDKPFFPKIIELFNIGL